MENWYISYDLAALAVLMNFLVMYFQEKRFPSALNKIFTAIVMMVTFVDIIDIFSVLVYNQGDKYPQSVMLVLMMLYFFSTCLTMYVFFIYFILAVRQGRFTRGRWYWYVGAIPAAVSLLIIICAPYIPYFIEFDEFGKISFGIHFYVITCIVSLYVLAMVIVVIATRKKRLLISGPTLAVIGVFILSADIVQIIWPEHRILPFAAALALQTVFYSIHKNSKNVSPYSGFYNEQALVHKVNEKENHKQPFVALGISFYGVESFSKDWGRYATESLQRKISDYLQTVALYENIYMTGVTSAVILFDADDDYYHKLDEIYERFTNPWEIGGNEYTIETYMSCMEWPKDAEEITEFLNLLDGALSFAISEGAKKIIFAGDYLKTRERMIADLETRQKVLERERRQALEAKEAAERADKSKSSFLAHMSHEIRTPLTAILGMTEIVLREETSTPVRRSILSIQNAGRSLLTIINDILDFSKIEAGKMELVNEPYHINSTLDAAFNTVLMKIGKKNIEFVAKINPEVPSVLRGDETRVRQVMLNFLTNAAKYTEMGRITLTVDWDNMRNALTCTVTDTGRGISETDKQRMFTSFERFDTRENRAVEGTGLGLVISKRLIEQMGGQMLFDSTYGKGSTFGFSICPEVIDKSPLAKVDNTDKLSVLVFTGDEAQNTQIAATLFKLHVNATEAHSVQELEKLMEKRSYTHLITNLNAYALYKDTNAAKIDANAGMQILVYPEKDEIVHYSTEYTYIMRPFSCISLAAAFLGNLTEEKNTGNTGERFIAPNARVLVVDDNIVNLQVAQDLMAPVKMHIDVAESGPECLEITKHYKYDIIFLDHMMPVMDGVDTLKKLREDSENLNLSTPVVAFTANAVSGMREQFKADGFEDYLSKPINIIKLESLLRTYIPKEKLIFGDFDVKGNEKGKAEAIQTMQFNVPNNIKGVDTEIGLSNMGGDADKYTRLLRIVYMSGKEKADRLEELFDIKDYADYVIEAHALKSTMASIGAMQLSELAKSLEHAGKAGNYMVIIQKHEKMVADYRDILNEIEKNVIQNSMFNNEEPAKTGGKSSFETYGDELRCIVALLKEFENELAEKLLKGIKNDFPDTLSGDAVAAIDKASDLLAVYKYDEACEELGKVEM